MKDGSQLIGIWRVEMVVVFLSTDFFMNRFCGFHPIEKNFFNFLNKKMFMYRRFLYYVQGFLDFLIFLDFWIF